MQGTTIRPSHRGQQSTPRRSVQAQQMAEGEAHGPQMALHLLTSRGGLRLGSTWLWQRGRGVHGPCMWHQKPPDTTDTHSSFCSCGAPTTSAHMPHSLQHTRVPPTTTERHMLWHGCHQTEDPRCTKMQWQGPWQRGCCSPGTSHASTLAHTTPPTCPCHIHVACTTAWPATSPVPTHPVWTLQPTAAAPQPPQAAPNPNMRQERGKGCMLSE